MAKMKHLMAAAAVALIGTWSLSVPTQSAEHDAHHPAGAAAAQPSPQAAAATPPGMAGQPGRMNGGMPSMAGGQAGKMDGGMPGMAGGQAGMMGDGCCMGAMGKAPGAGTAMPIPSALPGFPGASHLYHVGASGFFLDYGDRLGLRVEQTSALNGIKQRTLVEQSAAQRKIDEAEQALWLLTAADQPDAAAIGTKLREIEKLKSDERFAFISAVGEGAKVLNADQRKMVLGMAPMPGAAPPKA